MTSAKEQEPEQDQAQQFGGKSPGNLDLEVSPPVIVRMRSLNHAHFPHVLHYDRTLAGSCRAFIPVFFVPRALACYASSSRATRIFLNKEPNSFPGEKFGCLTANPVLFPGLCSGPRTVPWRQQRRLGRPAGRHGNGRIGCLLFERRADVTSAAELSFLAEAGFQQELRP